jgi:hypothetical protein
MEGILETAVQKGARAITREWQSVGPTSMLLMGPARARGFRLEGYGVFFDVAVPTLSQSIVWSWSILDRDNAGAAGALQSLRELVKTVNDPAAKRQFEQELKRLELQMGAAAKPATAGGRVAAGSPAGDAAKALPGPQPASGSAETRREADVRNPDEAYTTEVQNALVDAMLDFGNALTLEPEEWLTVAARGSDARGLDAMGPSDIVTIQIRIKGSDLLALRSGKISRDEARKRIEIVEF